MKNISKMNVSKIVNKHLPAGTSNYTTQQLYECFKELTAACKLNDLRIHPESFVKEAVMDDLDLALDANELYQRTIEYITQTYLSNELDISEVVANIIDSADFWSEYIVDWKRTYSSDLSSCCDLLIINREAFVADVYELFVNLQKSKVLLVCDPVRNFCSDSKTFGFVNTSEDERETAAREYMCKLNAESRKECLNDAADQIETKKAHVVERGHQVVIMSDWRVMTRSDLLAKSLKCDHDKLMRKIAKLHDNEGVTSHVELVVPADEQKEGPFYYLTLDAYLALNLGDRESAIYNELRMSDSLLYQNRDQFAHRMDIPYEQKSV